jgi:pimeloyl-ACP methyl ester carboxylesterase
MAAIIDRVTLASGRRVGVREFGNQEARRTLVLIHPTPGSASFDPDPAETARRDVRVIAVDRPGYGESDRLDAETWPSVAGAARDVAEVLRQMEVASAGAAGWSAGGRVALALAALEPDLIDRVAVIATPAPDEAVRWVNDDERAALEAVRDQPLAGARERMAAQFAQAFPHGIPDEEWPLMLGASEADAAILADREVYARLAGMIGQAFAQGFDGLVDDILGYMLRPWGFEPGAVDARTLLIYGDRDPVAGAAHGRWWQRQLPDARLEMAPGAGHLVIVPMWRRVLSHLAPGSLLGRGD